MTRAEKKSFRKSAKKAEKRTFYLEIIGRLVAREKYPKWAKAYRRRCAKRGVDCVLDRLEPKLGLQSTAQAKSAQAQ